MANYYTNFSFHVPLPSVAKERALAVYHAFDEHDTENRPAVVPEVFWKDISTGYLGFNLIPDETGVIITDEGEDGDIDTVAEFLKLLITEFNLPPTGFAWSNTCSKPRVDGFGGGALWVTKDGIEHTDTSSWLWRKANPEKV